MTDDTPPCLPHDLPQPDEAPANPYGEIGPSELEGEPAAPSPASISFGLIEGWF